MLRITNFLIAAALTALIAGPAAAQSLRYLGPHSTDPNDFVFGNMGVNAYNDLCSDAFDGSQMCESIDVLRSGSSEPLGGLTLQWIKPTLMSAFFDGNNINFVDASGVTTTFQGGLSCSGWGFTGSTLAGLTVRARGSFGIASCNTALPVACCKVSSGKK